LVRDCTGPVVDCISAAAELPAEKRRDQREPGQIPYHRPGDRGDGDRPDGDRPDACQEVSRREAAGWEQGSLTDSNPPHVFEIHPVSEFDNKSVLKSVQPIKGYKPKDAHDAFMAYEGISSVITPGTDTTTIRTVTAGYNYVKFIMELNEDPTHETDESDGRSVFAKVYDTDCELLLHKRRMIFVKDTPSEKRIKTLHQGNQLVVLGLPRIDKHLYARENGWAISGLAAFYNITNDPRVLDVAERSAKWVNDKQIDRSPGSASQKIAPEDLSESSIGLSLRRW